LSVLLRTVRGMSQRRCRRTPAGVSRPGLHLVCCAKYRRRIEGGRVTSRGGEPLEQMADERGWQIVAKEVLPDNVHPFRSGRVDRRTNAQPRVDVVVAVIFCASVGDVPESAVRRYLEHQGDAVRAS
jgi:putative transposase